MMHCPGEGTVWREQRVGEVHAIFCHECGAERLIRIEAVGGTSRAPVRSPGPDLGTLPGGIAEKPGGRRAGGVA